MAPDIHDTTTQRVRAPDGRPLTVRETCGASGAREGGPRSEYLLLCRLRGSCWETPVAYYRFPRADYLLTEATPGDPLSETGPLPIETLGPVLSSLIDGIRCLHALGQVHADLRPDCVLLDRSSGSCRVTIVGVGSCVRRGRRPRTFTPGYSAAEAVREEALDERADIYSIGAILFFLLTGEDPLGCPDRQERLRQRLAADSAFSRRNVDSLTSLMEATLSEDKARRPGSTRELEAWLRRAWPHDASPLAHPTSSLVRTNPRDEETEVLCDWLTSIFERRKRFPKNGTRDPIVAEIQGEPGIGAERLATHLLDLAEVEGWLVDREASSSGANERGTTVGRIHPLTGPVDDICVNVRCVESLPLSVGRLESGEPSPTPSSTLSDGSMDADLALRIPPIDPAESERLAGLYLESKPLRRELARLSLGNPALLTALLSRVSPICDLLDTGIDTSWRDGSLEGSGVPNAWVEWSRVVLAKLPPEARAGLIRSALEFGRGTSALRDTADARLIALIDRGLLRHDGRLVSRLWAESILEANPEAVTATAVPATSADATRTTQTSPFRPELGGIESQADELADRALVEIERGQLGTASRLAEAVQELLHQQIFRGPIATGGPAETEGVDAGGAADAATAAAADTAGSADPAGPYAISTWVFSRLGQFERMPTEPEFDLDERSLRVWQGAEAYRLLASGQMMRGRRAFRSLVDTEEIGPDSRVEWLVEWILTELDLGHSEVALGLTPRLRKLASDVSGRIREKVRLASCALELAAPGPIAPDLGAFIEQNLSGIAAGGWGRYQWRAERNLALFLEKSGEGERAARAWNRARQQLHELLVSSRNEREAQVFRDTPAVRGFLRDYHQDQPEVTASPHIHKVSALDGRLLYVKEASDRTAATASGATSPNASGIPGDGPCPSDPVSGSAATLREELRAEYLLLGRLRGSCWQTPVAHYRYPGADFMVTEAAPGRPISELVPLPVQTVARVFPALLDGFRQLHALGYVHADLKPDHVFLDDTDPHRITLIDVGSCVRKGERPCVYTAGWSSIEAIREEPVDGRADIYSLGAILFFLLTGRPTFEGDDWGKVLVNQFEREADVPAETPRAIHALLQAMLSQTRNLRPESVREVEQWLRQIWPRDPMELPDPGRITFPATVRETEESAFEKWLSVLRDEIERGREGGRPEPTVVRIRGERGIGVSHLATSFLDLSETRGWLVHREPPQVAEESSSRSMGRFRPLTSVDDIWNASIDRAQTTPAELVAFAAEATEPVAHPVARSPQSGHAWDFDIDARPLATATMKELAGLHLESEFLRKELAECSLGNPGLLAAILSKVTPICDLLNSGPDDAARDNSYESSGPPSAWVDWCRDLLGALPPSGHDDLIARGLESWLEDQPALSPDLGVRTEALRSRGLLTEHGGIRSSLWAQAVVHADIASARKIAPRLLARSEKRDPYGIAQLILDLDDPALIERFVPSQIDRLVDGHRYIHAIEMLCRATARHPEPRSLFAKIDLVAMTQTLSIASWSYQLSPKAHDDGIEWGRTQPAEIQEAMRLVCAIGRGEREGISRVELAGPRPTSERVLDSWIYYLVRDTQTRKRGVESSLGVKLTAAQKLAMFIWEFHQPQTVHRPLRGIGGWMPDDPNRPALRPPIEAEFLYAAAIIALREQKYAQASSFLDRLRSWSKDGWDRPNKLRLEQAQGLLEYEARSQSRCLRTSWAVLGLSKEETRTRTIGNTALAELEFGRLGAASRLADSSLEIPRERSAANVYADGQTVATWVLSRLGRLDGPPVVPDVDLDEGRRAIWQDTRAYCQLAAGLVDSGRDEYQLLVDSEEVGIEERVDPLVDWILTELDLGHSDFALGLADRLQALAHQVEGRILEKIRLASCALQLEFPGPFAKQLEEDIRTTRDGIKSREIFLYRWRAERNLAVFLQRTGRKREAAAAWNDAHQYVNDLFASCRNEREEQLFRNTPPIRGFFLDYHRDGRKSL